MIYQESQEIYHMINQEFQIYHMIYQIFVCISCSLPGGYEDKMALTSSEGDLKIPKIPCHVSRPMSVDAGKVHPWNLAAGT